MRVLVVFTLLLSLAACGGTSGGPGVPQAGTEQYAVADRRAAPDVRGDLLGDGGTKALADFRGDVVVVNFWASWCAPCRVEAGDLERTYQATKASGVSFLGINTRDETDQAQQFVRSVGTTFPSLYDPSGRLALAFKNAATTLPATVILDRDGRIAVVLRVSVREQDLRAHVDRLAAEPGGA